jgi:hypothetical protein
MSRTNGDRARFNRRSKARMHDRARIRGLRKALRPQQPGIAPKNESTLA